MRICSTREAARQLGISLMTLQRYMAAGKVAAPKTRRIAGALVRPWSARDIERQVAHELVGKRDVERVLREMVGRQQVQIAEQEAEIYELAAERRCRQEAETALTILRGQYRALEERFRNRETRGPVELKVAS